MAGKTKKRSNGKPKKVVAEKIVVTRPKKRRTRTRTVRKPRKLPQKTRAAIRAQVTAADLTSRPVVECVINPSSGGCRICTPGQSVPTALISLHVVQNVAASATYAGTYPDIRPGTMPLVFFRDPLCSVIRFTPNVGAFSYEAVFPGYLDSFTIPPSVGTLPLVPLYYTWKSGAAPHGPQLFLGFYREEEGYVWLDPGMVLTVTRTQTTSSDDFRVYHFDAGSSFVTTVALPASTGSASYTVDPTTHPHGGYFRVSY